MMWAYMASCDFKMFIDDVTEDRCSWMNSELHREVPSILMK